MTTTTQPYHPQTIEDKILSFFDVKREEVFIPNRGKERIATIRQIIVYCLWRYSGLKCFEIGERVNRHYTIIIHSVKTIHNRCSVDQELRNQVIEIEKLFE
jgi:chromosomal replication initiation ATPase DnaA